VSCNNPKPRLIVVVGPTGVGKSELTLTMAEAWRSDVISADSMQVYRYMDIGTAKPRMAEREIVPHHLIDVVEPDEPFNAAIYTDLARKVIEGSGGDDKTFFVVGGTGLYIKALLGGMFAGPPSDESLREYYRNQLKRFGKPYLYGVLKRKDEKAAAAIAPGDTVRIIRALEVWELTGRSIIAEQRKHCFRDRPYDYIKIGLNIDKVSLRERIERRTKGMIQQGLADEVKWLLEQGYHEGLKPMQSLGYRHMIAYLRGNSTIDDAVLSMNRDTKHYAKRQITWFSGDSEVVWFDNGNHAAIREKIKRFIDK
jgi:tRNA dimethylallyltransferase